MSRHAEPATNRHPMGAQRPARRSSHERKLQHGTRVVAVGRLTATTVEVLGHGVYEHAPASAAVRQRLAEAIEAADRVTQIDFGGRGFTDDDVERANELVAFFRAQGKISADIDPSAVLLSGWFEQNAA